MQVLHVCGPGPVLLSQLVFSIVMQLCHILSKPSNTTPFLPGSCCFVQVATDLVDKLAYYLWFAEYAYEAGTEPNLKEVLTTRGAPPFF